MNLVIVESPTKAKTIQQFLGTDYNVRSSFGHVRDLPKTELGIDIEKNFNPKYIVPLKSKRVVSELKKEAKKAKGVILATDEDREGESIAWHLSKVLDLGTPERIVFHEITKSAIEEALKNPRKIDLDLVDAQQARRILDRIVGYKLSPFLWKKVARGLSAGRVQSVAVRLVVEREREIEKFKPTEYWTIEALLKKQKSDIKFPAALIKKNDKTIDRLAIKSAEDAEKIVKELQGAGYQVTEVERQETKKNPLPPFTTSVLQQEAWRRLRFPAKFTMSLAQKLYENGYITYHRTDSVNLSEQSLLTAKNFIEKKYGKNYWAGSFRKYKAKGRTQEAHEAIRPTDPSREPNAPSAKDDAAAKLYGLIWRRFIACQMSPAVFDSSSIDVKAGKYTFRANGQILKFDGFLKIYSLLFQEITLPEVAEKEILDLIKLSPSQHFTQPPARYNEATLIKALEQNSIGRPSTYAPILSTIQERNYIAKNEEKRFQPTEIGMVVNDILVKHFPEIVDIGFTAKMEEELDGIAEGKINWTQVCKDFYTPFARHLEKKYKEVSKKEFTEQKTGKQCPECKSPLVVRLGRFGKFYACSAFPKCRYTAPLEKNVLGIKCPKCGIGELVEKRTKKGSIFYGCNRFPKCDFALWDKPTGDKCLKCGSLIVEARRKQIKCSNKDCKFSQKVTE